jgi:serine phosphatase RsbU (regulator of sigma subunit)
VALSDGIIETQDEVGNYYGINSVIGMVENTLPAHLPDTLVSDLKQFMSHGGQFHDDITLVVIENFD